MTSNEFLSNNKQLLIGAVGTKINLLEQKVRNAERKAVNLSGIPGRKQKIKELAIVMEWLESGKFEF